MFGNVFLFIDNAKVYTRFQIEKLMGLHKGNTVTIHIYQKATKIIKKLIINNLNNNKNAIMLLLTLH